MGSELAVADYWREHCPQCGEKLVEDIWIWHGQIYCTEQCVRKAAHERLIS